MGWRLRYFVRTLKHLRRAVTQSPIQGINLRMPGRIHEGPLPPFTPEEWRLGAELKADVVMLAETIGERNVHKPEAYRAAEDYIASELERVGYAVRRQRYDVDGVSCANLADGRYLARGVARFARVSPPRRRAAHSRERRCAHRDRRVCFPHALHLAENSLG